MKLPLLALIGWLSCCLSLSVSSAAVGMDESCTGAAEPVSVEAPSAHGEEHAGHEPARSSAPQAFIAAISTGKRTREFDSPARALSELQRAVWLNRRAGEDEGREFRALLTINGVEFEFTSADEARAACRSVIEALRRLAKVRATLEDVGQIPDADRRSASRDDARRSDNPSAATPEQAMLTIRQRVNQALHQEVRRNQHRPAQARRAPQTGDEPADRSGHDEAAGDAEQFPATAGTALEARRQSEIESVRRMLARVFQPGSGTQHEAATAQVKPAE